jgi:K+-sensing histidine kinase KdpD
MRDQRSAWQESGWVRPAVRLAALAGPLLTCALLGAVRHDVTSDNAVLLLVLWVVGAAAAGDRWGALLAAVSGGAWFDFFLTRPYHRFTISDREGVGATVLLVVISIAVSEIALWGHRQQAQASRRSGYLDGVLGASRAVVEGDMPSSAVVDVVGSQITDVLGADGCRFVKGPVHDARIAILDQDGVLTRQGRSVDVERVGLPVDEYVALPVRRGPRVLGHFLVTATSGTTYPTREQRRIAVLLADQVSGALQDESA